MDHMIDHGFLELPPADYQPPASEVDTPIEVSRPPDPFFGELSLRDEMEVQRNIEEEEETSQKWSIDTMRQVRAQLSQNIVQKIRHSPLVFLIPPSEAAALPNNILLDANSPLNTLAINHEHWLNGHQELFKALAPKYRRNAPLYRQVTRTLRKIESELLLLNKAKVAEWKHQRTAFTRAGGNFIDSRECFILSLALLI